MPTPAVGGMVGTSCEFLARAPGVLIAPAHRTCLVHRCPGLSRNACPVIGSERLCFCFVCVCVGGCVWGCVCECTVCVRACVCALSYTAIVNLFRYFHCTI